MRPRYRWIGRRPVFIFTVWVLALAVAIPALRAQPLQFEPLGEVFPGGPASELDPERLEAQAWVGAAEGVVWTVDVARGELAAFRVPEPSSVKKTIEETAEATRVTRSTPGSRRIGAVPLPQGLTLVGEDASEIFLAPISATSTWLVDRTHQRAWRYEETRWLGPWSLGEPVSSGAANPEGLLVLNTPEHPIHPFVLLNRQGRIFQRFGERRQGVLPLLDPYENSWILAGHPGGDFVAVHAFAPALLRFSKSGELRWKRVVDAPVASQLDEERRARLADLADQWDLPCVTCRLIGFAEGLAVDEDGGIYVRYGRRRVLDLFDAEGKWERGIEVGEPDVGKPWTAAGIAVSRGRLFAYELRGLIEYVGSDRRVILEGRVVAESLKGIPGAQVTVSSATGSSLALTTREDGRFSLPVSSEKAAGEVHVSADGHLPVQRTGRFQGLLSRPFVLERAPEQCVQVLSAGQKGPVREFSLTLIRDIVAGDSVRRETGPTEKIFDEEGLGCVEAPWSPPWIVRVEAPGFARAEVRLEEPETVEVELERQALLVVTVVAPDDEPVGEAEVKVLDPDLGRRPTKTYSEDQVGLTDEEGQVTLEGLPPATYRLLVEHPDFLFWENERTLERGRNREEVHLSPGARLRVQTTDAATGAPVKNVHVSVRPKAQRIARRLECETEASGSCTVEAVPPGTFEVHGQAEGWAGGFVPVAVSADVEELTAELELRRGVRVEGWVLGIDDYPGQSFEVVVSVPGAPPARGPVGSDGRFALADVPSGEASVWVVEGGRATSLLYERVRIPADQSPFELTLELPVPVRVRGRLTHDGMPCGACTVTFGRLGAEVARPRVTVRAGADGSYRVRLPKGGIFDVRVEDSDTGFQRRERLEIRADRTLDFDLAGAEVAGRVMDHAGEPVAGAWVQMASVAENAVVGETNTGRDGRFHLRGIASGSYRVHAWSEGAAVSEELEILSGETAQLELALPPEERIRLRLFDAASGLPIGSAAVMAVTGDGHVVRHPRRYTDKVGILNLPVTESSQGLTAVVKAPGYGLKTIRDLFPAETPVPVALSEERSFSVAVGSEAGEPRRFELRDADGRPVALSLSFPPGPVPFSANQALFNGLEPGSYTAILYACDGTSSASPLMLAPGQVPTIRFPAP